MSHPYRQQPDRAFWKRTVSPYHPMDVGGWYEKRFSFADRAVATAGSCFAQHIGRNLRKFEFNYLDTEPAPRGLPEDKRLDYGYEMYSARYGNVYTSRQLLQLFQRAFGTFTPKEDYWERGEGVVDPFRPTIEPAPFSSVEELRVQRKIHLKSVAELFRSADIFVFTLGLTEAWLSREDGAAFPLCPGTAGGVYDPDAYAFHNLSVADVIEDMQGFIDLARGVNPDLRFFLTVSPVPLMATATDAQVAVATTYSKSVLRAAAGELYQRHDFVDYFPSYEIITSPFMKGYFFEQDGREVSPHGVAHVMDVFFSQHEVPAGAEAARRVAQGVRNPAPQILPEISEAERQERVRCDEELLNSFKDDEA